MERQRNRPEKYNRELVQKTVKAMEKITEVCSLPLLDIKLMSTAGAWSTSPRVARYITFG